MSSSFQKLSEDFADAVEAASAAVVRVEARRRIPATGIVWSADGLILSAHHVVRRDDNIQIGLADGSSVSAQVVGRDPSTDLALLKAEANGLTPLTQAESIRVGNLALALGRPGKTVQATFGVVSAYGDSWRTAMGGEIDRYLQTDVLMYPGFSGGPLIGAGAALLGLNTSALASGVSTAVPLETLQRVATTLLAHGRIQRGYLGVSTQRVRLPENLQAEVGQKSGLLIVAVEPDSPAEAGGLLLGDTIVKLGETAVTRHEDLLYQLSGNLVNQKTPIIAIRGGELRTFNVTIAERK